MFTETQLKMITPDGNIYRYIGSDIVDEFNVGDCADISFPNGYGKGKRTFQGIAPCLNTTTTASCFIVKEDVMNLKEELCKHLIDNNLVEEYDVIKHSYSTSRMNDWEKRNVETNNISPTLDTRCDCLGVVVKDGDDDVVINPLKGKSPYGWHFEQNVYVLPHFFTANFKVKRPIYPNKTWVFIKQNNYINIFFQISFPLHQRLFFQQHLVSPLVLYKSVLLESQHLLPIFLGLQK